MSKSPEGENPLERGKLEKKDALTQISPYFPREWLQVTQDEITVTKISGGYMNTVHLVERSTDSIREPNQVILRHKGGGTIPVDSAAESSGVLSTELEETVMALEASRAGVGPALYGIFSGGRIEEYVKCHTLTHSEVLQEDIVKDLAKCYARFHQICIPFKKTAFKTLNTLVKYGSKQLQDNIFMLDMLAQGPFADPPGPVDWDYLKSFNYTGEYEWVTGVLEKVGYRLVTIAGDPNYLNVLIREGPVPDGKLKVVLVDYEFASIQPRGIELGGHFANRLLKWNDLVDKGSKVDLLTSEERQLLINTYVDEVHRLGGHENLDPLGLDSKDHITEEVDIGILFYLVQFGFFIVGKLRHLTGDKSFPTAAVAMLKNYEKIKVDMLQKYPHWK